MSPLFETYSENPAKRPCCRASRKQEVHGPRGSHDYQFQSINMLAEIYDITVVIMREKKISIASFKN